MMSVSEYAIDVDKSIEEILLLCKDLNINASLEDDMLSDDDIILLDNEIANHEEESEEDQRDEPRHHPHHVLEHAHARLHRGPPVLAAQHLDAFVRKTRGVPEKQYQRPVRIRAELLKGVTGVWELPVHPGARTRDNRRRMGDEVLGLPDDERAAKTHDEPQGHQNGEQHQHDRLSYRT